MPFPYSFSWDGRDENGEKVAGGVYFCYFKTDKVKNVKKLIVLK